MKRFLFQEIIGPASRRIGTAAGSSILAVGATQDIAGQVEVLVPALVAFGADFMFSHFNRKKGRK